APGETEVHGLVALMEIQASREKARTGPNGEPVLLHEQNRGRWDQLLIRRGFTAMLKAREIGGPPGPYVLQAAIIIGSGSTGWHVRWGCSPNGRTARISRRLVCCICGIGSLSVRRRCGQPCWA
ncbi:DUF6596 domain-containing protein, partial [Kibdelosporangium lantanae]